jgi:hypothetical protein
MSPNSKTTQKPTTVPPHISINNGWMGTFQVPILCACMVWKHMRHMNERFIHLGHGGAWWSIGNRGRIVFLAIYSTCTLISDILRLNLVHSTYKGYLCTRATKEGKSPLLCLKKKLNFQHADMSSKNVNSFLLWCVLIPKLYIISSNLLIFCTSWCKRDA